MTPPDTLDHDGVALAYRWQPGAGPTVVFLPGYMSDMSGSKAEALAVWAERRGRGFLRLDYSGCGASGGDFADGTISRWADDALAVIDAVSPGTVVLVGSSMGAWIALRIALARPETVAAVVTIAGAPDFTDWGLDLSAADDAAIARDGFVARASLYGAPYRYYAGLIAEGAVSRVLGGEIAIDCRVRLLHGQADPDVPWHLSLDVASALRSSNVQVTLIKDGDHRLSRPQDLALLSATLDALEA
ncbi:alpha/beta fold hydrolase [Glacieibacterium megasporae]|uniref:alpha/beta fold hydrolase n=1 Tax=Glacieibacterium megasporae TaxID=2835787 RepID=UPI001C1E3E4A|nr:alpha/beta hydrolase [Polymorphobacter megasporae]UAJ11229.1 alpha/beta hydrolase [Polymorphobacter megasporae]